jgi:hypothetical protein
VFEWSYAEQNLLLDPIRTACFAHPQQKAQIHAPRGILDASMFRATPGKHRATPCPLDYFTARGKIQAQKRAAPTGNAN